MNADPPRTHGEAMAIGAKRYLGNACKYGHVGWRYTKGKNCIECVRIARGGWHQSGRRTSKNMALAFEAKSNARTTYIANRPCRHGHFERCVESSNCVECTRRANERRKLLSKFSRIRSEYGLSREDYLAMVAQQGR